jgi:putative endonuclease
MAFYTYLLANGPYGTLYCGHTDCLAARVGQHRERTRMGFASRYGVDRLVWFEPHESRAGAFQRERQIKKWNREWKIRMIEEVNPTWADLYEGLQG